ncbi:ATP-binding protein [Bacillus sp. RG28]|uniref:ATP-binding protein n=1 Tax=Gottfriedia endophytica TaxID=2820819 RepID=A0A940NVB3_9BACI|nr:ATP-binding protein [Gottfriedia endophytica]MBP0725563.1 ATP-binding protein [Gottfriedia endophytica]
MSAISDDCMYKECDGTGLIFVKDHEEKREFMRECKCKAVKQIERKLKSAQIPEEFKKANINSFKIDIYQTPQAKKVAETAKIVTVNFVKNFKEMMNQGKGLYFYSKIKGSGKTRLAASVLNAVVKTSDKLDKPLRFYYTSTSDLLEEIKKTFNSDSKVKSEQILEAVKTADLLVLDDIGVEKVTDWVEETFTRVLDYRLQNKKVTIFTSNLTIEQLDMKYQQGRVSSRIEKMSFPVAMPEESIRKKLARSENEDLQELLYKR